jgi:hypothetical protein
MIAFLSTGLQPDGKFTLIRVKIPDPQDSGDSVEQSPAARGQDSSGFFLYCF